MYVNTVVLLVTIQCVYSRTFSYQQSYMYNWSPVAWNYRIERSPQQIYFQNSHKHANHYFSQNPHMFNAQLTVQTGFHGTRPINFQTNHWNSHPNQPFVQIGWPNMNYNNKQKFHQIQMPFNQQFSNQNMNQQQQIVVENLNGNFQDFIRPSDNQANPAHGQNIQYHGNQGGAVVHGQPIPTQTWSHPPPASENTAPVTRPPYNNNVPQFATATKPAQTATSTEAQQENASVNGDEQFDIDVRFGPA